MESLSFHIKPADKAVESHLISLRYIASLISPKRDIDLKEIDVAVDGLHDSAKTVWRVDCLPKSLFKKYNNLRAKAENCCATEGVKTDHGFVAIKSRATCILETLSEVMHDWQFAKEDDLENYESICEQHLNYLKSDFISKGLSSYDADLLVQAVKDAQPSKSDFEHKVNFSRQGIIFPIDETGYDDIISEAQNEMAKSVRVSTMQSLVSEICSKALEAYKLINDNERKAKPNTSLRIHSRTVATIVKLKEKMYELSFIHKHVKSLHDAVSEVLSALSSNDGALRDKDYQVFKNLMLILSDHDEIKSKLRSGIPLALIDSVNVNNQLNISRDSGIADPIDDLLSSIEDTVTEDQNANVSNQQVTPADANTLFMFG